MILKILLWLLLLSAANFGQTKFEKDFSSFWTIGNEDDAYLKERNVGWKQVKEIYQPQMSKIQT